MPSDEMNGTPGGPDEALTEATEAPVGVPESAPVTVATGYAERARRRKLALLALLLLVLALLAYVAYYFDANRRLPLPQVTSGTTSLEPPQYLYSITGQDRNALTKPIGLAVGRNGRAYVVDFGTRSVKVFTVEGSYLFSFNQIEDGANKTLRNPVHMTLDGSGNVWVTDRRLRSIYVFDADGKYLRKFVPDGNPGFEWSPLGLTFDEQGDLYVTDIPGVLIHRVLIFDKGGKLKRSFGQGGQVKDAKASPGTFSYPNGIAIGAGSSGTRDLFVADSNNRRVQVYSPSGSYRRIIATEGTPRGLAIDSAKRLYVVDVLSHQVDIFSAQGQKLATFGGNGFGPGQFQYPEDIALDRRGRIYVTDRENNQVQVWGFRAAEIPGVTKIAPGRWWLCLVPLPLLLIPLFFRKRRFVVTEDFVQGMITAEMVPQMVNKRWRWIVTESAHPAFVGREVDGVDLGQLLEPEPFSHSDAKALADRLGVAMDRAAVLAMAKRTRVLCTEDAELGRLAVLLGVDAYDRAAFVRRFVERGRR
jgi:DNA-binding beta-propeller fold protein YncE